MFDAYKGHFEVYLLKIYYSYFFYQSTTYHYTTFINSRSFINPLMPTHRISYVCTYIFLCLFNVFQNNDFYFTLYQCLAHMLKSLIRIKVLIILLFMVCSKF